MGSLAKEFRKVSLVIFDRFMQSSRNPDEARLLAEASRNIPKERRVVIVDSDLAYGNARALALDLYKTLGSDELLFLAHNKKGLAWAQKYNIPADIFSTKSNDGSSQLWDKLIRAKVSVYDTHNWWRTYDQLLQRSLLDGSFKIQLWHGAAGPVVKGVGLERLSDSKSFWHFSSVATSSTGFNILVNESREAQFRSLMSIVSDKTINDVEYRIVSELLTALTDQSHNEKPPNLLIAPTYPESLDRENALLAWLSIMVDAAATCGISVTIRLHPGSSRRIMKKVLSLKGKVKQIDESDTVLLSDFSLIATDFSAIAHDAILLNLKVISVWTDLEGYSRDCPVRFDSDQIAATYIAKENSEILESLLLAAGQDPLASERSKYIKSILSDIGASPGVNTREAIVAALNN